MSKVKITGETSSDKSEIEKTIVDLIKGRLLTIKTELLTIDGDLSRFSTKYLMDHGEFLSKYDQGLLGDDEDFFTWKGTLKIQKALIAEQDLLREALWAFILLKSSYILILLIISFKTTP